MEMVYKGRGKALTDNLKMKVEVESEVVSVSDWFWCKLGFIQEIGLNGLTCFHLY